MLPLPNLVGAVSGAELLDRADRRDVGRRWMRARLVEDPVLYRRDLDEGEWGELRRRLGEEVAILDEMFGLVLESRAEGMAAVDPTGTLADQPFPTGGTVGHAALLVLDRLRAEGDAPVARPVFDAHVAALASEHARGWANEMVEHPDRLANVVLRLLVDLRLAELVRDPVDREAGTGTGTGDRPVEPGSAGSDEPAVPHRPDDTEGGSEPTHADDAPAAMATANGPEPALRLLPAAGRFLAVVAEPAPATGEEQPALW
jgi:hypothetical protein